MRSIFGLFLLLVITFASCTQITTDSREDIIIENEQFKLVIRPDGTSKSLVFKPTGEECLVSGENIPIFSVTQARPYHNEIKLSHPNKEMTFEADSVRREGDSLIVGFELVPYEAIISIKETPEYLSFRFEDYIVEPGDYQWYLRITPPPATELCFIKLPVKNRKHFGEWLNVSWDNDISVNLLGTDAYARIDADKRNGYRIMRADAVKEIKPKGVEAALIVCRTDELLDKIARIEEDYHLPNGVRSRRDSRMKLSYYWSADAHPGNIQQHLKYAKMGGFRNFLFYYTSFIESQGWRLLGDYEWDKSVCPNGKNDLSEMLNSVEAEGIIPGVQFLHTFIGLDSRYVTPVPDHRLNLLRHYTLAAPLSKNDSIIYIEQNPEGTTMADGCRMLKLGTELISFREYTTVPPYRFIGCQRGVEETTVNSQPEGYIFGLLDVCEYGARSVYLDQNSDLQDEIAVKLANIYNAGFKFIYFDGSEGVNSPFWYHVPNAQYRIYKLLEPEPMFAEGAAKTHFSWHMLTGGNAFDVFPPESVKEEIRRWPAEEAPRMRDDFTRINFGWLGYRAPDENTIGTQPDMLEYATSRAAGWDCPVSLNANLERFEAHPRTPDNLEVLRRWEEVRIQKWLTVEQKEILRDLEQEHILLLDEQNEFELVPYDQIAEVANGSREIRAFSFQRKGDFYVVFWHISENKKLELPIYPENITLLESIGMEVSFQTSQNNSNITVPVGNRRFLKIPNVKKEELINAFRNGRLVN